MAFEKEDIPLVRGLKKAMDGATFPLQPKDVPAFSRIYNFVVGLEKNVQGVLDARFSLANDRDPEVIKRDTSGQPQLVRRERLPARKKKTRKKKSK